MGLGAGYLGTEFWCNMSPALRFELCRMAVADPDIAPLLKGLGSRNQRVRESENWLALAQVAAMHYNFPNGCDYTQRVENGAIAHQIAL